MFNSSPLPDEATPPTDAALIAHVQHGETELFAELVARYQPALRRVARSRLGRSDWAEDVVQETFLAAFKSRAVRCAIQLSHLAVDDLAASVSRPLSTPPAQCAGRTAGPGISTRKSPGSDERRRRAAGATVGKGAFGSARVAVGTVDAGAGRCAATAFFWRIEVSRNCRCHAVQSEHGQEPRADGTRADGGVTAKQPAQTDGADDNRWSRSLLNHELRSGFRHPHSRSFPTGTSCDVPVEAHLSDCPECHRLAEALRPAIELFQEAVGSGREPRLARLLVRRWPPNGNRRWYRMPARSSRAAGRAAVCRRGG